MDTTSSPIRKRLRLHGIDYAESGRAFSVTIDTARRSPVFDDLPFGRECVRLLRQVRATSGTRVFAYCLMPDRVHLLLGMARRSSLPAFIGAWKVLCHRERKTRGRAEPFWERHYHDRAIRAPEALGVAAEYVLGNPVRAGLVPDFHDYPLCGSFEFDV